MLKVVSTDGMVWENRSIEINKMLIRTNNIYAWASFVHFYE